MQSVRYFYTRFIKTEINLYFLAGSVSIKLHGNPICDCPVVIGAKMDAAILISVPQGCELAPRAKLAANEKRVTHEENTRCGMDVGDAS